MRRRVTTVCLYSTSILGLFIYLPAVGQEQGNAGNTSSPSVSTISGFDEIIVTAQKRSERLSDVPMSITAVGGDQLLQRGITSTEALTKLVPGFTFQVSDYGTPIYSIRGIGFLDLALGAVPAVTAYVDEVPLPFSIMTRGVTMDLERVEILKGPQGTLFGQNSTGGAINYLAAKPTEDLSAGVSLTIGRFETIEGEAFISGPIAPGLTARLSTRHEYADGWQRSMSRPDDRLGDRKFNSARLLLDWQPSDQLKFSLNANGWNDRSETPAVQFRSFLPKTPANPANQFVYDALSVYDKVPDNNRDADWDAGKDYDGENKFRHISLRGDWSVADDITITSITAFSRFTIDRRADKDGTDFQNIDIITDGLLKSFFQELRVAGSSDQFNWMLGASYQDDTANQSDLDLFFADNTNIGPLYYSAARFISNQRAKTKSIFGGIDYQITDTLKAQLSGRYSHQKRHFTGCSADSGTGDFAEAFNLLASMLGGPANAVPGGCITMDPVTFASTTFVDNLNQGNYSWRFGLDWKFAPDQMLYGNISKGYKFGGYSIPAAALTTQLTPATQESVVGYEAGFKLSFDERRVQFNGAAFYYDYKDKQIIGTVLNPILGGITQLINVPKSRIAGAELELLLMPIDGLRLSNSMTYVASKVKANPLPPGESRDPLGNLVDFRGNQFPNTPKWQFVSDAEYAQPLTDSLNGFVGATYSYRSKSNAALGDNPMFTIDSYGLLDLRAGIEDSDGTWRVQVWGRNVTNKYYWTNVGKIVSTVTRLSGNPATYGITFSYRY